MKQVGQFLRAVILFALDMRPLSFYPTFAAPRTPYVIGHFRELSFLSCLSTTPHPKGAGNCTYASGQQGLFYCCLTELLFLAFIAF